MKDSIHGPEGGALLSVLEVPAGSTIEVNREMTIDRPLGHVTVRTVLGSDFASFEGPLTQEQTARHDSLVSEHDVAQAERQAWMAKQWNLERARGDAERAAQARRVYGSGWTANFNLLDHI